MKTTQALLNDVRRQLMLPNTAALGLQDADLLAAADIEMTSKLYPLVLSVNQEYMVATIDLPIISGQRQYRMPIRAAGGKIRDVTYILGNVIQPLAKIEIEQLPAYSPTQTGNYPWGFYLEAGSINLVYPATAGTLRVRYYTAHCPYRPAAWNGTTQAATARLGTVTYSTTNTPNDTVEFTVQTGGTFTPIANGNNVDFIASNSPYEYLGQNLIIMQNTSPYRAMVRTEGDLAALTPATQAQQSPPISLSPNIRFNDIVCFSPVQSNSVSPLTGTGVVVQLPDEAYQLLVYRVCINACLQIGDLERAETLEKRYLSLEKDYLKMFSPRVDGSPTKLMPNFGRWNGLGWRGGR